MSAIVLFINTVAINDIKTNKQIQFTEVHLPIYKQNPKIIFNVRSNFLKVNMISVCFNSFMLFICVNSFDYTVII